MNCMSSRNEIQNELQELNSELVNCQPSMPFDMPQNYFNELTANIHQAISSTEWMEQQNMNPYTIPQNYFNELPKKITQKIETESKKDTTLLQRYPYFKYLQAAAVILFLVFGGMSIIKVHDQHSFSFNQQLQSIPDDAVKEYILQSEDGFDNLETTSASSFSFNNISANEITQYLDEQGW